MLGQTYEKFAASHAITFSIAALVMDEPTKSERMTVKGQLLTSECPLKSQKDGLLIFHKKFTWPDFGRVYIPI